MYNYDAIDQRTVDERVAQFRAQTRRFPAGELIEEEFRPHCGFDAFALKEGWDAQAALAAFSEAYQAAADRPLPLFRRREALSPDGAEHA